MYCGYFYSYCDDIMFMLERSYHTRPPAINGPRAWVGGPLQPYTPPVPVVKSL